VTPRLNHCTTKSPLPSMKQRASFALVCIFFAHLGSCTKVRQTQLQSAATADFSQLSSPWLGLLTTSWTLPSIPDEQKPHGLDQFAEQLVNLAKLKKSSDSQHPDAEMLQALNTVADAVEELKRQVNISNTNAQKRIDDKKTLVDDCDIRLPSSGLPSTGWINSRDPTEDEVRICRERELELKEIHDACLDKSDKCQSSDECCDRLIQPNDGCNPSPQPPDPSPFGPEVCPGKVECKKADIEAALAYFRQKRAEYNTVNERCDEFRQPIGCPEGRTIVDCSAEEKNYTDQKAICNGIQVDFENQYCQLNKDIEGDWTIYAQCYSSNETALDAVEKIERAALPNRQQEYRGMLRIGCLVDALNQSDSSITDQKISTCISTTYTEADWPHLVLNYYYPMGTQKTCQDLLREPGTESFVNEFYSQIPEACNVVDGLASSRCTGDAKHCAFLGTEVITPAPAPAPAAGGRNARAQGNSQSSISIGGPMQRRGGLLQQRAHERTRHDEHVTTRFGFSGHHHKVHNAKRPVGFQFKS